MARLTPPSTAVCGPHPAVTNVVVFGVVAKILKNIGQSMPLSDDPEEVRFGRFRFDLRRRRLLHDSEPVEVGGRALDVLCLLASAGGGVVSKDELMTRLWPQCVVAENNLHVHISALRKALDERSGGDSYIVTVPGRGYRLAHLSGSQPAGPSAASAAQHLPLPDKPSIAVFALRQSQRRSGAGILRRWHG
jgi:DNA-binding winged helix-turn-helix (wHTH) protein